MDKFYNRAMDVLKSDPKLKEVHDDIKHHVNNVELQKSLLTGELNRINILLLSKFGYITGADQCHTTNEVRE